MEPRGHPRAGRVRVATKGFTVRAAHARSATLPRTGSDAADNLASPVPAARERRTKLAASAVIRDQHVAADLPSNGNDRARYVADQCPVAGARARRMVEVNPNDHGGAMQPIDVRKLEALRRFRLLRAAYFGSPTETSSANRGGAGCRPAGSTCVRGPRPGTRSAAGIRQRGS